MHSKQQTVKRKKKHNYQAYTSTANKNSKMETLKDSMYQFE
jgi:hypothetical protein